MAAKLDVAARLAEARQAVDNTQSYVWAAHLLDYQNADLTLHPAQVRDWFSSEDGMDLRVLDADSTAVQAAAGAAGDALARQRDQLTALAAAWQGAGAASAEEFLRRHCHAAEMVASSARQAAETLAGLRDVLWQIVDTKVAAVTAIDDRRRAERPAWLTAAQTVTTGAGDRAAASELVDKQVKPFVDNDIRNDWLTAVRTAIASIGSSYDAAIAGVTAAPVKFDVPGDLGPEPAPPPPHDDAPAPRDPGSTTTAAPAPSPSAPASSPSAPPASYSPPTAMPAPAMAAMPAGIPAASTAPTPAALPASSPSGFDGLAQPVADALRGLLPRLGDNPLPAKPELDAPTVDAPTVGDPPVDPPEEAEAADKSDDESDCDADDHSDEPDPSPDTVVDDAAPAATPSLPAEPPEAPAPEAPAPEAADPPPPAPEPPAEGTSTPCEIAASELPQAGQ